MLAGLALLLVSIATLWLLWNVDGRQFLAAASDRPWLAAGAYVALLAASIVAMPVTSLPLLPLGARLFGVVLGGFLSALGWWIGALIAFLIARWVGRPVLKFFVSLDALDRWEQQLSDDMTFLGIVVLRMVTPVDVVSFGLGLLKHLSFPVYAMASLIGILPFAFVWTAVGNAIDAGSWILAAMTAIAMTVAVILIRKLAGIRMR